MSQRGVYTAESVLIKLTVVVDLDYISNHNGITDEQYFEAKEEFESEISERLYEIIEGKYQGEDFLESVDFVNFTVHKNR